MCLDKILTVVVCRHLLQILLVFKKATNVSLVAGYKHNNGSVTILLQNLLLCI